MGHKEAQSVLEQAYKASFLMPACTGCETGEHLGDVLVYDEKTKEAAVKLGVLKGEFEIVASGVGTDVVLMLRHDPSLCPVKTCGHGEACCMTRKIGPS